MSDISISFLVIDVKDLSCHLSFTAILKRSGAPMELIRESLGYKSLHTTEAYLDSFEDQTRRKFMENLMPK